MSTIDRRGFLGGLVGGAAALVAPLRWAGRALTGIPDAEVSVAEQLARLVADGPGVARVGATYLAVAPEEGDPDRLLGLLAPAGEDPVRWWSASRTGALRRSLRDAARADFAAGAVVDLDGWQLSRTEGRLAALVHLSPSMRP